MKRQFLRYLAIAVMLAGSQPIWPQNANIIAIGSPIKYGGTNAPDTYSDASTFSSTPVLVNNGRVRIWQEQVPTGTNGEWDIFHMETVNGGPLAGNINAFWNILIEYTLRVPASFDMAVDQWKVDGVPVSTISNFGAMCCASLTNPILPGPAYFRQGFNGLFPAGVQSNWQEIFVQPYNFAASGGVPVSQANGFSFALHFTLRPADAPVITAAISAGAYGAFQTFAAGSWVEIYGRNFSVGDQMWTAGDFTGTTAPTKLGGATVTIGGRSAFVNYISPGQVNVQAPSGIGTGPLPIVLTTPTGASAPFTLTAEATKPGLLAPSSFAIGGTQQIVALFSDGAYVLPPGAIAGVNSRRARPGDTIIFFGIGFGDVTPNVPAGQIAQRQNALASPVTVSFGGIPATVTYQGLAPNFVGLYQLNVIVPNVAANDAVPLTVTQGGVSIPQSLAIAVGN
ncbi:MAG: hypothetical protein KIT09_26110 [Bryobacteraceae bacterium]|nr:hypothetical protein [Bryobacteraceae bacterium]